MPPHEMGGIPMLRKPYRFVVLVCTAALSTALFAGSGAASVPGAAQGITKDSVEVVVLVADLDGLRAQGLSLPAKLTVGQPHQAVAGLLRRVRQGERPFGQGHAGGVEPGRPEELRAHLHQGHSGQQAVRRAQCERVPRRRASGASPSTTDTFMFYGESVYGALQDASGKKLVSLGVPGGGIGQDRCLHHRQGEVLPEDREDRHPVGERACDQGRR